MTIVPVRYVVRIPATRWHSIIPHPPLPLRAALSAGGVERNNKEIKNGGKKAKRRKMWNKLGENSGLVIPTFFGPYFIHDDNLSIFFLLLLYFSSVPFCFFLSIPESFFFWRGEAGCFFSFIFTYRRRHTYLHAFVWIDTNPQDGGWMRHQVLPEFG